ncbi:MAG: DUF2231 domain-containing protein [Candidatus Neomarinimicrobiota bacterium]|jgi:uncharacterized membrane protein|nr:DUF2231 domain-containing protein [Candidatus Neomarinimicrobiota bacterium]HJN68578.1 DUF2231 domain-containing protein [Candidatus Neomarinimicrobiota bacterium]|tara:strand:- start:3818 stop:4255 length:438 start_codon:yes stop_codon:yes gene_type:complete
MNLPLHPAMVHYPIALITAAFIFQAIHLWKNNWICRTTSMWLLGLGAIMSIAATLTGENEAARAGQVGYDSVVLTTIQRHELLSNITTWGSILVLLFWIYLFLNNMEDRRVDYLALAFLGLLSVIVIFSSYLGDTLTFIHGVGIK